MLALAAGVLRAAAASAPTLFIAGDSTAAKYTGTNPQQGWGEYSARFSTRRKCAWSTRRAADAAAAPS